MLSNEDNQKVTNIGNEIPEKQKKLIWAQRLGALIELSQTEQFSLNK